MDRRTSYMYALAFLVIEAAEDEEERYLAFMYVLSSRFQPLHSLPLRHVILWIGRYPTPSGVRNTIQFFASRPFVCPLCRTNAICYSSRQPTLARRQFVVSRLLWAILSSGWDTLSIPGILKCFLGIYTSLRQQTGMLAIADLVDFSTSCSFRWTCGIFQFFLFDFHGCISIYVVSVPFKIFRNMAER